MISKVDMYFHHKEYMYVLYYVTLCFITLFWMLFTAGSSRGRHKTSMWVCVGRLAGRQTRESSIDELSGFVEHYQTPRQSPGTVREICSKQVQYIWVKLSDYSQLFD